MSRLSILALVLCACQNGIDSSGQFEHERKAVEAAFAQLHPGRTVDISDVPVYVHSLDVVQDICPDRAISCTAPDTLGPEIFAPDADVFMQSRVCVGQTDNPGCWATRSEILIHEYTHAALLVGTGDGWPEHGPVFWTVHDLAARLYWPTPK